MRLIMHTIQVYSLRQDLCQSPGVTIEYDVDIDGYLDLIERL